ncbi:hypothetical protein [Alicyclobacillus cellulosilyticus]|uniref:hypothetical protein n=1 Tax=Alicyclobacillus cellulosilyticus TaxID=1003997 RepID=UPI0016681883|nr:hypothetical protein [Alicyclobacillus cellulosilyticus]
MSLAAIHTTILGVLLTIACGVLYQVVPIAFQAPPLPRHVLYWHLPLHLTGVIAMGTGFLLGHLRWTGLGGGMVVLGVAGYAVFLLQSYTRARNRTPVHRALLLPWLGLLWVFATGLWQALLPIRTSPATVMNHVVAGGMVFWSGLVLVISYKFIPMFTLSHGYRVFLRATASLYFTGGAGLLLAAWLQAPASRWAYLAGSAMALLGLASFTRDVVRIVRARKRKRMVLPVRWALACVAVMVLCETLVLVAANAGWSPVIPAAAFGWVYGGWLGMAYAYMHKIVPFLWFEYRFSHRPERKTAPLIDEMASRRLTVFGLTAYGAGVAAGVLYLLAGAWTAESAAWWLRLAAVAAGCGMTLGTLLWFVSLRRVLTIGGPRPEDG